MQRLCVAPLCCDPAKLQQSRRISRLLHEDTLDKVLAFGLALSVALALQLLRKQKQSMRVLCIELDCLAQLYDGLRWIAAFALKQSQQIEDLTVAWRQLLRLTK